MSDSEKQPARSTTGPIYVDNSVPATLRYTATSVSYETLAEAREAWLALPIHLKKDASIQVEGKDGALYQGWDIYRLWHQ